MSKASDLMYGFIKGKPALKLDSDIMVGRCMQEHIFSLPRGALTKGEGYFDSCPVCGNKLHWRQPE